MKHNIIFSVIFICLFFLSAFASKRRPSSNHVEDGKVTLRNILENSQSLTCRCVVKEVLLLQSDSNSTSDPSFEQFYHYLFSLWKLYGIEKSTREKWRAIFESLIKIPALRPKDKASYYRNFFIETGILPQDFPITLDVNHLDRDFNRITEEFFGLSFPLGREETCLKLIYVYFEINRKKEIFSTKQSNNLVAPPNPLAPRQKELRSSDSLNHFNISSSDSRNIINLTSNDSHFDFSVDQTREQTTGDNWLHPPPVNHFPSRSSSATQESQATSSIKIMPFIPTVPDLTEFMEGDVEESHSQASPEKHTEKGTSEGWKKWTWVHYRVN